MDMGVDFCSISILQVRIEETEEVFPGEPLDPRNGTDAVAGMVAAAQKAIILDYLETPLRTLLFFIGMLSVGAAITSLLALGHTHGTLSAYHVEALMLLK